MNARFMTEFHWFVRTDSEYCKKKTSKKEHKELQSSTLLRPFMYEKLLRI